MQFELTALMIANKMLTDWVAPEYTNLVGGLKRPDPLDPPYKEIFEEADILFVDLKDEWINHRAELGLPPNIHIEIPDKVREWRQKFRSCKGL